MISVTIKERLFRDSSCRSIVLVNNNGDEIIIHPDIQRQLAEHVYGFRTLSIGQVVLFEDYDDGTIKLGVKL